MDPTDPVRPEDLPDLDDEFDLEPAAAERFRRAGHAVVRHLASPAEVAAYRPAVVAAAESRRFERRPLEERDTYGRAFLQMVNVWTVDEAARRLVCARRFAKVAADLLGVEGVRLYHDQALFKEPGGGPTPWHQDQVYWPLDTTATITMWMPLVEVTAEVGSMTFVTGSHRLGDTGAGRISDHSQEAVARLIEAESLALESHGALAPGDATFHAGWTLHSAGENPTAGMREVITVIYFADGARVSKPSEQQRFDLQLWLKGLAPGDLAASDRLPLLYSRPG
jgi:ectoine hydroxylase-related dioxygenase (phytanoyl-CoA dioxygenase family)